MKFILLAATAAIATPLMAQDMTTQTPPAGQTTTTPAPADQTMPPSADPATTTTAPPPADPATTGGTMAPAQSTDTSGAPMGSAPMGSGDPAATDPAGGYQPAQPAVSGTPAPGATVRFQPAQDPNTAYPPPAPMQKYPICKKGQYDNCMQRGGR